MCPYCGNHPFMNSWGEGNAMCCACGKEFDVVFVGGRMEGVHIEADHAVVLKEVVLQDGEFVAKIQNDWEPM